jgi:hypothetical protein
MAWRTGVRERQPESKLAHLEGDLADLDLVLRLEREVEVSHDLTKAMSAVVLQFVAKHDNSEEPDAVAERADDAIDALRKRMQARLLFLELPLNLTDVGVYIPAEPGALPEHVSARRFRRYLRRYYRRWWPRPRKRDGLRKAITLVNKLRSTRLKPRPEN